jgi:RNA polymerase sigma-70 factor (ECF subfamily)
MMEGFETWLADAIAAARAAWPGLDVSPDEFTRYLAPKIAALPDGSFRQLRTSDLYLACACAERKPAALSIFEERYGTLLGRTLDRMRLSASAAEEYRAQLREALFFTQAKDAPPLIASYSGRGELGSWLRSIATRAALKIRDKEQRNVEPTGVLDLLPAEGNPELEYLRTRYAHEFQEALLLALGELSPRERNLLRQHYLDGLSIDAVGRLYRVHRATAARWLAEIRDTVLTRVKDGLRAGGALSDSELESVLRMARSGFDLSISTLLPQGLGRSP